MSEYRRFISYIYEYRKERKANNCGYVKVEVRNNVCRVRLHLQATAREPGQMTVYAFIRQGDVPVGIPLGNTEGKTGVYEFQYNCPVGAIGGFAHSISDVRGIWLRDGKEKNYITIWDDEPIEPGQFREISGEDTQEKPAEESFEDKALQASGAEASPKAGSAQGDLQEGGAEAIPKADSAGGLQEGSAEASPKADSAQGSLQAIGAEASPKADSAQGSLQEGSAEAIPKADSAGGLQASSAEKNPETGGGKDTSGNLYLRWEQFLNHYPQVSPFADEEITQCICIALKDISFLQKEEWYFARNTFVRQAYMQYHHLLLGCHKSGHFVLGVPGECRSMQDRHMAGMFGFPYFKETEHTPGEENAVRAADDRAGGKPSGYWYHFLNEKCPLDI